MPRMSGAGGSHRRVGSTACGVGTPPQSFNKAARTTARRGRAAQGPTQETERKKASWEAWERRWIRRHRCTLAPETVSEAGPDTFRWFTRRPATRMILSRPRWPPLTLGVSMEIQTLKDIRMVKRAVMGNWNVRPELRREIVQQLAAILKSDEWSTRARLTA